MLRDSYNESVGLECDTCAASGACSDRTFLGAAPVSGPYPLQPLQPSEALLWWWCSTIWDGRRQGNWNLGWGWDKVKLFGSKQWNNVAADPMHHQKDTLNGLCSSVHLFSCVSAVCRWINPRCKKNGPCHIIMKLLGICICFQYPIKFLKLHW